MKSLAPAESQQLSIRSLLAAMVFFAVAASCYRWAITLAAPGSAPLTLVAAWLLAAAVPGMSFGGILCIASSWRNALVVSLGFTLVFAAFTFLTAMLVIPMLVNG